MKTFELSGNPSCNGVWRHETKVSEKSQSTVCVVPYENRVYYYVQPGPNAVEQFKYYDTVLKNWQDITFPDWSPSSGAQMVLVGKKIFFFGRMSNSSMANRYDYYDIETDSWTRIGTENSGYSPAQSVLIGDEIWMSANYSNNYCFRIYNLTQNTWTTRNLDPSIRERPFCAIGKTIYWIGRDRYVESRSYVYKLDTETMEGQFTNAYLPPPYNDPSFFSSNVFYYSVSCIPVGEDIYLLDQHTSTRFWVYHTKTDTFEELPSLLIPQYGRCSVHIDGILYAFTCGPWYQYVQSYQLGEGTSVEKRYMLVEMDNRSKLCVTRQEGELLTTERTPVDNLLKI